MSTGNGDILVVDDEMLNRVLLSTNLCDAEYTVALAEDGECALDILKERTFDLVLLDLLMPRVDGFEVLKRMKSDPVWRHIPVIIISAADEMESIVRCIEMGATDYLPKPFNPVLLHARINACLATKRLHDEEVLHKRHIEETNRRLEQRVAEQVKQIREGFELLQRMLDGTVQLLASAIEMRDPYTAGHQRRVADIACVIAREMGLSEHRIEGLRIAGILHDIGKIAVPAEILCKPGRITEAEFNLIKSHPQTGYDILKAVEFPWPIADMVRQHQERMDGSGYPQRLAGDAILMEARILAVADVLEAMASHRPYRPSLGIEAAMEEIVRKKGQHFDPGVVEASLAAYQNGRLKM